MISRGRGMTGTQIGSFWGKPNVYKEKREHENAYYVIVVLL